MTWPDAHHDAATEKAAAAAAADDAEAPTQTTDVAAAPSPEAEAGAAEAALPSSSYLVALHSMAPASGSAGAGKKATPSFLALRSDGVIVTLTAQGALINGVSTGLSGLRKAVRVSSATCRLGRRPPECAQPRRRVRPSAATTRDRHDGDLTDIL